MCHMTEFGFFCFRTLQRLCQLLFITPYKMCVHEEQCVFSGHLSRVGVWVGGQEYTPTTLILLVNREGKIGIRNVDMTFCSGITKIKGVKIFTPSILHLKNDEKLLSKEPPTS